MGSGCDFRCIQLADSAITVGAAGPVGFGMHFRFEVGKPDAIFSPIHADFVVGEAWAGRRSHGAVASFALAYTVMNNHGFDRLSR